MEASNSLDIVIWAGWIGGIGVGAYAVLQYWLTGRQLGCSAAYGSACGIVSKAAFFQSEEMKPKDNWRIWFLLGLPLGGVVAVLTSPDANYEFTFSMGALYDQVLPDSLWAKGPVLIIGGIFMGLGARMAGGCTSGHAINGCALLNPPSLLAAGGFFLGGLVTVQSLFGIFA